MIPSEIIAPDKILTYISMYGCLISVCLHVYGTDMTEAETWRNKY